MKEETKELLTNILAFTVAILVFLTMLPTISKAMEVDQEEFTCYEYVCQKKIIDQFESCINLGRESTGFLSSQHYFLCDGIKVPNQCLEYGWVETKKTNISAIEVAMTNLDCIMNEEVKE